MPRHNGRGRGGGGGSRRGNGGGRGGGGRGGFRGGRGGRGAGGNRGAIRKKSAGDFDPYKKFKHIQRNQEAEDLLRQRKQLESSHLKQLKKREERVDEEDDEEEEPNPMDQLLQSLQTTGKKGKKSAAIESSDSEMSGSDAEDVDDEDEDIDEDEVSGEEDDELDGEDEEMDDEADTSDDDDDDFQINEQFEEQSTNIVPTSKHAKDEIKSADDEDELDSSDEDEDQILRPEESKAPSKTPTKSPSKKDYVIYDSNEDESEEEEEEDEDAPHSDQDDAEERDQTADIFSTHLDNELSPDLLECVNTTHSSVHHELNWPKLGRIHVDIPSAGLDRANGDKKRSKSMLLDEDETYAAEGQVPKRLDHKSATLSDCGIKNQMHPHVSTANSVHLQASPTSSLLTGLQSEIFSIMNNYQDLYFPARTHDNGEEIRFAYCLHALNHILKTRAKILHHNAKLSKMVAEKGKGPSILPDSYRDQGLFRPKVLIVVPFRESALRVVNMLIALIFPELGGKVAHYARFQEEFGGEGLYFPKRNPKPEDYEKTFAGNSDDTFRLGICITRKSMKLYSDFYSSDILIVSPLGLRMIVGAPGEKDRDYDFLASIELMVLDQAELFLAQNWDHLLHVMDHLHLQPQSARNTDFSRVRSWCLNGWARFYRQTLLFTSHELPEFRSLFNSRCSNYRGKVRVANPVETGTIRHVAVQVAQLFHRVEVTSIQTSFDQRFNHFVNTVLPQFKGASMAHSLILVPSYFDFVRLRNYFKKESVNFVQICEYTKDAKVARSRDMFFHSGAHFMLYSERAHFFRRTRVKGIRHLIMYQPPTWPHFYPELINLMQEAYQNPRDGGENSMTVTVLYTKYDMLQVSAIVGSERAAQMAASDKATHMFMSGE